MFLAQKLQKLSKSVMSMCKLDFFFFFFFSTGAFNLVKFGWTSTRTAKRHILVKFLDSSVKHTGSRKGHQVSVT